MKKMLSAIVNGVIELRYNLLRSSLSLLGIILGVMNLSAMFSVMNGAKIANKQLIDSIGTLDQVSISLDWRKVNEQGGGQWWKYRLRWSDLENIRRNASTIKNVGVEIYLHEMMQYGSTAIQYTTIGVLPANFEMNKYTIARGRMITDEDIERGNRVCVIGTTVVEQMFKDEDPLGKIVKIRGDYFTIVGIMDMFGSYTGESGSSRDNPLSWKNRRVLIPATTCMQRFLGLNSSGDWFSISVQSKSVDMVQATMREIRNIMIKTHNDKDVFNVDSIQEWQNDSQQFMRIWQIVLGVVSGISLMVGGIGIMNVMLASFRERMREIGIRKAVGASNTDIFLLFIVETIVICIIGGFIGLIFGYIVSVGALNAMMKQTFQSGATFSIQAGLVAVVFSLVVGLLSGLYPALKAAKLSPVEALRYE